MKLHPEEGDEDDVNYCYSVESLAVGDVGVYIVIIFINRANNGLYDYNYCYSSGAGGWLERSRMLTLSRSCCCLRLTQFYHYL